MTDKIAIIICTANRYALLEKAVASLQQQSLPRNQYQIIVVDNSATTPEVEQAREKFASMTDILFHVEPVQGLSHARNVGMALAHDYPIIGYIDDDAMAAPTWAESAVLAFQHLPQVVGVGGPVAPLWEIPRPTWLADNLLCYLSVLEMGNQPRLFSVNQGIHGASMAFRADALKAAGGFPVNLGRKGHGAILLSNDETALVKTMRMKGGQFAYVPDMRVQHWTPASRLTQDWFRQRIAWQMISDLLTEGNTPEQLLAWYATTYHNYLETLPVADRNPSALYADVAEPEKFGKQLMALYSFLLLTYLGKKPV